MKIDIYTKNIKAIAEKIGFDVVGVTKPGSLIQGEQAIQNWVEEGLHGSMKYLENFAERKTRFFETVKEVKSVIVLGVNYYTSHQSPDTSHQESKSVLGRVARYAWGKDYHEVIRRKHEELICKIQKIAGEDFQAKSCVDIQPIPERFAAVQSGLGFIGKHTNLLNQKFGPWLFLSEIVTNLDLEEDIPSQGDCGTCTHCQTVCPTGALDQDYKMDARRCIAYLTIEHKGIIPRELRPKIKNWIFGCDECLAICPFTSKSKESSWKELTPAEGKGEWLNIDKLFELKSNSDYEREFQGTALLRASRKQMLRNACIILGNSGDEKAIPYLMKALQDKSPLVRLHAAWALAQFPQAKPILEDQFHQESDKEVQLEIEAGLQKLNSVLSG